MRTQKKKKRREEQKRRDEISQVRSGNICTGTTSVHSPIAVSGNDSGPRTGSNFTVPAIEDGRVVVCLDGTLDNTSSPVVSGPWKVTIIVHPAAENLSDEDNGQSSNHKQPVRYNCSFCEHFCRSLYVSVLIYYERVMKFILILLFNAIHTQRQTP